VRKATPEPITPQALAELIQRHSRCVLDQKGKCPLLLFVGQMCWELNEYFLGIDSGLRRHSEMTCAKPLGRRHFEELE